MTDVSILFSPSERWRKRVRNTDYLESFLGDDVDKVCSFDLDRLYCKRDSSPKRNDGYNDELYLRQSDFEWHRKEICTYSEHGDDAV